LKLRVTGAEAASATGATFVADKLCVATTVSLVVGKFAGRCSS